MIKSYLGARKKISENLPHNFRTAHKSMDDIIF